MGLRKWVLAVALSTCALAVSVGSASATSQLTELPCPGATFPYLSEFAFPVAAEGFAPDCHFQIASALVDARTGAPAIQINANDGIDVDSQGHMVRLSIPDAPRFDVVHPTGVITSVVDPDGTTNLTYDARGRLTRLSTSTVTVTVSYDAAGRVTKLARQDGRFESFAYNAAGKLTGFSDSGGDSATLTYNSAGRLQSAVSVFTATDPTDAYTFDGSGNVLSWSETTGTNTDTRSFVRNGSGDVATVMHNGTFTDSTLTYAAPHKLSKVANGIGGTIAAFSYNAAGQLVATSQQSGPVSTFSYDQAGRLTSMTNHAGATSFSYDALGRLAGYQTGVLSVALSYRPGPAAVTGGTSGVKPSSVTLKGTINPHSEPTAYHFQFGKTRSYGHSTKSLIVPAGTLAVAVKALLHGLGPATTYHYRLVATNPAGASTGVDRTFKTKRLLCHVPNLIGDSLGQAKSALKHAHCKLGKVHKPRHGSHLKVVSQHPSAGSTRPAGSKVSVKLAKS